MYDFRIFTFCSTCALIHSNKPSFVNFSINCKKYDLILLRPC